MLKALLCALLIAPAIAQEQHQPRDLGNRALMTVYWYAPETKEITHADVYLFKDEQSCKDSIPQALRIAVVYASEGDRVSATCSGVTPPEHKPKSESETDL